MTNFNRPYFASSISEFWHRWHISLSTWFRDYVYIPLGGNRVSKFRNYFNLFITFVVSGIWHGANWTFAVWGSLHGFYLGVQKLFGFGKEKIEKLTLKNFLLIALNLMLVLLAWVFFRANSLNEAFTVLDKIFTDSGLPFKESVTTYIYGIFGLIILLVKEIHDEYFTSKYRFFEHENPVIGAFATSILVLIILSIGVFDGGQFIYFQF
jgi:D-alanyl-lipoteichoic acid acyltransferase DltB (MBOAT superfamily)